MTERVPFNYGGLVGEYIDYEKARVVVLPVPFEKTTTWQRGTAKGPKAIIEASMNMELYDIETDSQVFQKGIYTLKPIRKKTAEEAIAESEKEVLKQLDNGKFVVTLGGEHTIALGPIRAFSQKIEDLSVLHLDAHGDRRDEWEGSKYNHGCVMARAGEIVPNIISVGIRSIGREELDSINDDKIFYAEDIHSNDLWMDEAIKKLSKNVYLTIDLDMFDISILPGTGTPEPGGLGWYQTLAFLKKVATQKNLVGFDVVELRPMADEKSSDFLAAKLIYKILSYQFLR